MNRPFSFYWKLFIHRIDQRMYGTPKQRLLFLWSLVALVFIVMGYLPIGIWDERYNYQTGLERSWALTLLILWFVPLTFLVLPKIAKQKRIIIITCIIIVSGFGKYYWSPEQQFRRAFRSAKTIKVTSMDHVLQPDGTKRNEEYIVTQIINPEEIRQLFESAEFTDPPWKITRYFTRRGSFTFDVMDENNEALLSFDIVSDGSAILARSITNTDLISSSEFQKALMQTVLNSIPNNYAEINSGIEQTRITFGITHWQSEQAIELLADNLDQMNFDSKLCIVRIFAYQNMSESKLELLKNLSEDSNAEIKKEALRTIDSISDH